MSDVSKLVDRDVVAESFDRYRSLRPIPRTGPVASIVALFDDARARLRGPERPPAPAAQLTIDDVVALVDGLNDSDVFPERAVRIGARASGGER